MEGGLGNNDVELLSKTLQVEHKLFYFDFKENPRGRYLKISEKTSGSRSTIIVPVGGVAWFVDLFNYYVNGDDREILSKELQLDTKVFYFDVGENKRGRFLKCFSATGDGFWRVDSGKCREQRESCSSTILYRIWLEEDEGDKHNKDNTASAVIFQVSEASVTRSRSTIIVPAGNAAGDGWAAFRNILGEINEASQLLVLPSSSLSSQQASGPSEPLEGLSDDVGAGFLLSGSTQVTSGGDTVDDKPMGFTPVEDTGVMVFSKAIRADQKKFFFDLGSNPRGQFLRISEVTGADRSVIILPVSALEQFHNVLGQFVDIVRSQGLAGSSVANVRTVAPPHRQSEK